MEHLYESVKRLDELYQRDTAKKVTGYMPNLQIPYPCPSCKYHIFRSYYFCPTCGQRLDWSYE